MKLENILMTYMTCYYSDAVQQVAQGSITNGNEGKVCSMIINLSFNDKMKLPLTNFPLPDPFMTQVI